MSVTAALRPCSLLLRSIILRIPAEPSASYLADGDVITSTRSIDSAGNCLNASVEFNPTKPDGLPFIKILTSSFPRRATLPSTSTETEGTLSSTSLTVPPLTVKSLPTLITFLSTFCCMVETSAITVTSSKPSVSSSNKIRPRSTL